MDVMSQHPRALPYLFLTEMWERFGYYVVQGMLVLYLTQGFGFSDDQSYTILGVFSALAYIAPMVGGFIADRLLGFELSIIWGGVLLSIGYAFLSVADIQYFYYALATIIIGNGLFKPNISSLLGMLYPQSNTLRDAGFTIFYIGINLGVLLAGLTSGYVKNHFGWQAGFGLASVGLIIGLCIFLLGLKWGGVPQTSSLGTKKIYLKKPLLILYLLIMIPLIGQLLQSSVLSKWLLPIVGIILVIFMFYLAYAQKIEERKRLITLNILIISSVVFWMLFLQIFFSANLFIDRLVSKSMFGIPLTTTVFYSLESIFVILLGPLFAHGWHFLNKKNKNPSSFIKFVLAILFLSFTFYTLALSTYFMNSEQMIAAYWILFAYFLLTIGELLLSPIGLSAVTMLSPQHLTGMMMGIWFVGIGFGGQFAGLLAKLSSITGDELNVANQLSIYRSAFFIYANIALFVAAILFFVQYMVKDSLKETIE